MKVRSARIQDVPKINALVNDFAEQDRMLFRSMSDIYENLQAFLVAEADGAIVGCCALEVIWSNLAEIKSLAVTPACQGQGLGGALVEAAVKMADQLGVPQVFALTMEPAFFEKRDFKIVEKDFFPMKVWSDCARCPKQDHCDEVAVIRAVDA